MRSAFHQPDAQGTQGRLFDLDTLSPGDAIIESTLTGRVVGWNDAAQELLGYRVSEVLGRNVALFSPPDRLEEIDPLLTPIRQGNTIVKLDTERVRKDGTRIHVAIEMSPVRTFDGQIIGARTTAHALCA